MGFLFCLFFFCIFLVFGDLLGIPYTYWMLIKQKPSFCVVLDRVRYWDFLLRDGGKEALGLLDMAFKMFLSRPPREHKETGMW